MKKWIHINLVVGTMVGVFGWLGWEPFAIKSHHPPKLVTTEIDENGLLSLKKEEQNPINNPVQIQENQQRPPLKVLFETKEKSTPISIEVYDLAGKLIHRESLVDIKVGQHQKLINVDGYQSGVYAVCVNRGEDKRVDRFVILD